MLKKINVEGIIKCFKLIRTKRNIYGVFEPYPPHTLHEYIQEFKPSFEESMQHHSHRDQVRSEHLRNCA